VADPGDDDVAQRPQVDHNVGHRSLDITGARHILRLDDAAFRVIDLSQADIAPTSIVHIPPIGAVIAGVAICNGVNPFLAPAVLPTGRSGSPV
jgi:hypothetical protein